MKAIVYEKYGPSDVLEVREVPAPVPGEKEVLVEVCAASVVYSDLAFVRGKPFLVRLIGSGLFGPKYRIPGVNIAGRVKETGSKVTQFQPGDEVFGDLSEHGRSGFAEFACADENVFVTKPANITFEEAAAVPQASVVALQGLRKAGIRQGQKALIYGASGGIGTFAVQIAKSFGAEVTGVCSTKNVELVRSLGADHVIDYTKEDFSRNGQGYDLILATAGYRSIFDYRQALAPQGSYMMTGGAPAQVFQAMLGPLAAMFSGRKMGNLAMRPNRDDLLSVKQLIEDGKVKPVVDRVFPLEKTSEALSYYGEGHARGVVVINVKER